MVTDEGQFRQALMNILRNALEAMPTGGTLTLVALRKTTRCPEGPDTGVGIEDSFKERLFEPLLPLKPEGLGWLLFSRRSSLQGAFRRFEFG